MDDTSGSLLKWSNHDLDTANSVSVRNLCLDRVSRACPARHKLRDSAILLRDSIKPKLRRICRIDDSVVLDGLSLVDQAGSSECSSKGLNDGFTTYGIYTSEENLDCEGSCRLEAIQSASRSVALLANCLDVLGKCGYMVSETYHEQA